MNRSAWAARYRQLGRDAAFLLLSGPLSLLAFYLVVPLTALGVVTTIIWVGLLLLIIDLSIAGGFANIARLAVARVDGREPVPGGYLVPEPGTSARRRLFRRLRDPQRWMDLLWAVIYFPVSFITWIISVVWQVSWPPLPTSPLTWSSTRPSESSVRGWLIFWACSRSCSGTSVSTSPAALSSP